jgi:large subunit ribosomal protein L15
MKKDKLPAVLASSAKRLGRGPGSGKGKTSGRGTKGQNARGRLSLTHSHFEGGQRPLIKRLPYNRGKGNSKMSKKPIVINLDDLSVYAKGEVVSIESLIKKGSVIKDNAEKFGVKVLGDGALKVALEISVPVSKSAAVKIEKAGGNISHLKKENKTKKPISKK